ncbi:LppA-related lipoprotein [Mesomycoplasma bovoculi]|uniref:Putative lipoprotein n=1 Tax=Mesomycoplasma bovoculi M165/69 TaxID=743966 RepID=W5UUN7_9BACT|nr:hypothetical protein [Mesomycoplasma bovoculi]AHH45525.1 putative lipoprotein [Mesomycoplasma bovoculi M165/69]
MKKKKWVVTSVLTIPIIAMISCETPNEIQKDLDPELPQLPQLVLRPEEPSKPEKPKSTTPKESLPTTPPATLKPEEPKKIDPIKTQPSNDKPILDESKKPKDPNDSLNKQDSNPKSTIPSDKPEEPKIERNFPNQPNNKANSGETSLPQKKDSGQENQESREKLKKVLESIPTGLVIAKDKVNQFVNPNSILYKFQHDYSSTFSYQTFVEPLSIDDNEYKINFDFSKSTSTSSEIQNVELKLTDLKTNYSEKKNVNLLLTKNSGESNFIIKKKELPTSFKQVFPSFLAFALLNSNKTIDDSIFSNPEEVIEGLGFGVGLIDSLLEIENKNNHHYTIQPIKAIANDDQGTLTLTVEAKNRDEHYQGTLEDSKEHTFVFENLAKNSDDLVEFTIDNIRLTSEAKSDQTIKSQINRNSNQPTFALQSKLKKLVKKYLQVHIKSNQNITNYKKALFDVQKHLKDSNHILFPQIIFSNSFNNGQNNDGIKFKWDGNKKITYTWNLDYQYLDYNQPITENSGIFPESQHHTKILTGTIDFN